MSGKVDAFGGKPLTGEYIEELSAVFERNWSEDEVEMRPTSYGKALAALQALDMPAGDIEALERQAQYERKPLPHFIRSILQNRLVG
jgi:hypothetical protein